MRDRFTVADLRFFAGDWGPATVARLLESSAVLGATVPDAPTQRTIKEVS